MIKKLLVVYLAKLLRLYIRYVPFEFGKWYLWSNVLVPYVNWRKLEFITTTKYGLRHKVSFPDLIQEHIYYFGIWEPSLTSYVAKSLAPGDVFVDVGANIRYFTCLASKLVGPTGQVFSVEASPSIYRLLEQNIELNKLTNVTIYNKAVYNQQTKIPMYKASQDNIGASTTYKEEAESKAYVRERDVEADTLDKIIKNNALYSARLVKIDVEGAEWFVLDGIKNSLGRFCEKTEWLVEITPAAIEKQGGTVKQVLQLFVDKGYQPYQIENIYSAGWYMKRHHSDFIKSMPPVIEKQIDILFSKNTQLSANTSP